MHNRDPRIDPKDRANSANALGVSVPVKGDSAASNSSVDSDATLVDFPQPSSAPPDSQVDYDATQVDTSPVPRSPAPRPRSPMSAAVLQIGDVLGGRYEIVQLLGEGGMGAVYKAIDRELDRPVALKLIRPQLASNPSILARFKQELLLARQVTHKNVIRIYDLGDADGVKFITMEFVEGDDLRALIQEKTKFSPEEAVEIMQQVCLALEAAHGVGVIHRDLKPQNIMRDKAGRILVMDFGLARTVEGDGMTQTGALVGTMEYMSPEQALAKNLDQRSDLFAVGLILYELLTGKTPYSSRERCRQPDPSAPRNERFRSPITTERFRARLATLSASAWSAIPASVIRLLAELLRDLEIWQGKRSGGDAWAFNRPLSPGGGRFIGRCWAALCRFLCWALSDTCFADALFATRRANGRWAVRYRWPFCPSAMLRETPASTGWGQVCRTC